MMIACCQYFVLIVYYVRADECYTDCSVCEDDYAATLAFTCAKCSGSSRIALLVVVVISTGAAAVMAVYLTAFLVSMEPTEARMTRPYVKLLKHLPLQAIKILVVLWQILTQV